MTDITYKQSVYPAIYGAFPAVSFYTLSAAIDYANELQAHGPASSGVSMCLAESYFMHLPDTVRRNGKQ